ncbi:ankyrin repeat domain-containing protein [Brachyspira pilosicoli]|uniref:ankyrin repeat domain-containing protein n=1 Tax=Brachyspira pilosicoli TaxID=52584 RepID=UPI003004A3CB
MEYGSVIIIIIVSLVILTPVLKRLFKNIRLDGNNENIHIACLYGDLKKVKALLKSGININSKDFSNKTPLMYAAEDGAIETVNFLINNGANLDDVDVRNESALIIALKNYNIYVAKILIENGANLLIKNEENKDALQLANEIDSKEIIELIQNKLNNN